MSKSVEVIPSTLSLDEIAAVKDYFYENRKYEVEADQGRPGWSYESLFWVGLYKQGEATQEKIDDRIKPLLRVLDVCEEYFLSNYKMKWDFAYKRGFLNSMQAGTHLPSHSDDEDIYSGKRSEEIHYSGLLFLTGPEEYEGGEVFFWDYETDEDIAELKPNVGDLVLFKGNTMHGVKEITSGERINYVIFYRDYNPDSEIIIDDKKQFEIREEIKGHHGKRPPESRP